MLFRICLFTIFLVYLIALDTLVDCNDRYNLLPFKQRYPRSNSKTNNNEEFEKFFLKASKSVPRIGRRGSMNENYYGDNTLAGNKHQFIKYPYALQPKRSLNKNMPAQFWADIAQIYEYNPELPNMMEYLANVEQEQGDDPSVYDLNNMRYKKTKILRNNESLNKEVPEYRLQAEV